MMTGNQVRLFLADGTVGGLMRAEILNWTGHMLRGRQSELGDIKRREEAKRTGVYVLFGTNDKDEPAVYIGERMQKTKTSDTSSEPTTKHYNHINHG